MRTLIYFFYRKYFFVKRDSLKIDKIQSPKNNANDPTNILARVKVNTVSQGIFNINLNTHMTKL